MAMVPNTVIAAPTTATAQACLIFFMLPLQIINMTELPH